MKDCFSDLEVKKDPTAKSLSYFYTGDIVAVNRRIISQLIEESKRNDHCDIRLCLHKNTREKMHQMIILKTRGNYYRPHRHPDKVESYHMIEGKMALFIFDSGEDIAECRILSSDDNFLYQVGKNRWHVSIPLSEYVVYIESTTGPFNGAGDTDFAPWAPDGADPEEAMRYFETLLNKFSFLLTRQQ